MAPIIIALVQETALSLAALAAIIVSSMLILMIGILQPAKGATIALQWWFGMHGFVKERGTSKEENPMPVRSEEHTSELQSLMRISYAVFCLKKKKKNSLKNHNRSNKRPN